MKSMPFRVTAQAYSNHRNLDNSGRHTIMMRILLFDRHCFLAVQQRKKLGSVVFSAIFSTNFVPKIRKVLAPVFSASLGHTDIPTDGHADGHAE